ncbi:MAG TPA: hypothetical protein VEG38_23225 [Acidimicrobiia bacterium]|nr:hypothetical protein [Acidimicrobiia bacterium]
MSDDPGRGDQDSGGVGRHGAYDRACSRGGRRSGTGHSTDRREQCAAGDREPGRRALDR